MSPFSSNLDYYYPDALNSRLLDYTRYNHLWTETLIKSNINGSITLDGLQYIYETTKPLVGTDKLEVGKLYLITREIFDSGFKGHKDVDNKKVKAQLIMVAWKDYDKYIIPTKVSSGMRLNYVKLSGMVALFQGYGTTEFTHSKYLGEYNSGRIMEMDAGTLLEIFSYHNMGGIYSIPTSPQRPKTLNYSRGGF